MGCLFSTLVCIVRFAEFVSGFVGHLQGFEQGQFVALVQDVWDHQVLDIT